MVEVLDHGYVNLLRVDGNDSEIASTARTSTQSESTPERDIRLVNRLVRDRHTSPVEFVGLVLEIQMPIFVARQWMRHRTGAFNEFSLRYSEAPDIYYVPSMERCQAQSTFNKQGSAETLPEQDARHIRAVIANISDSAYKEYRKLLDLGLTRELARSVLPVNFYTKVRWKIDLHNLMHFMKLREDPHAQWEIQQYANVIHDICAEHFPAAMEAFENHIQNAVSISDDAASLIGGILQKEWTEELRSDVGERFPSLVSEVDEFVRRTENASG